MAMDLINLGVGIHAHRRITDVASSVRAIDQRVDETELSAVSLRRDIEKLYLVVEALWSIVRAATDLKDEDLLKLMRDLDLQDGKSDGRNATHTAIRSCPKCGRTLLKGQTTCAYCESPLPDGGAFRHAGQ